VIGFISQVVYLVHFKGIYNLKCDVRPFSSNNEAIPEEAIAIAISPFF
jgi:hypothetical protein